MVRRIRKPFAGAGVPYHFSVSESCELCLLQADLIEDGHALHLGGNWWVNQTQGSAVRTGFVIQNTTHTTGLGSLDPDAIAALGPALADVTAALESHARVARAYVLMYSETPGLHPHLHVVLRYVDDEPGIIGPNVFLTPYPGKPLGMDSLRALVSDVRQRRTIEP